MYNIYTYTTNIQVKPLENENGGKGDIDLYITNKHEGKILKFIRIFVSMKS
jgi:hypothetical protein